MANRATKHELEARIDQTELLLLKGFTNRSVQKALVKQYGVSNRTAIRYVSAAYKRWRENALEEDGRSVGERRVQHERMIMQSLSAAYRDGRVDLQLKAINQLIQLHGTAAQSSKVEVTGKNGGAITLKDMPSNEMARLISDAGLQPK